MVLGIIALSLVISGCTSSPGNPTKAPSSPTAAPTAGSLTQSPSQQASPSPTPKVSQSLTIDDAKAQAVPVSYEELYRNTDSFKGKLVTIKGKVVLATKSCLTKGHMTSSWNATRP